MSHVVEKHLPGRHNQKTHNPYKGKMLLGGSWESLESSEVFQRALQDRDYLHGGGGPGDQVLMDLAKLNGFTGPPKLASSSEIDGLIANGHTELYRGIQGKQYVREFKEGEYFAGTGVYGSGIYTAVGESGFEVAKEFTGRDGAVVRMALSKDAKVIDFHELVAKQREELDTLRDLRTERLRSIRRKIRRTDNEAEIVRLETELDQLDRRFNTLLTL